MKKCLPKFNDGGKTKRTGNQTNLAVKNPIQPPTQTETISIITSAMGAKQAGDSSDKIKKEHEKRVSESAAAGGPSGDKKGLSAVASAGISAGAKVGGAILDSVTAGMDVDENSSFKTEQAVGDALLQSGNPYAMLAGAVVKLNSGLNQAFDTNMNTISKKEASEVGIGGAGRILNNVGGFMANIGIPGFGAMFGKTNSVKMSEQTKAMSNAFAGSVDDISTAEGMSGGRYLVGRGKINDAIAEANRQNNLITRIANTNTQRKASDYGLDLAQQNLNRYAGNNYQNIHVGKNGLKLMSIEECRRILESRKGIEIFQNGGIIGIDVNVIPEGKYHAHKNHLDEISEEFEDLTKKGIPVVAKSEGGEIEQIAEVEKMEIIFRLDVTRKLEELFEDGSDEAMVEAGKLLTIEIMENTQDNSGEVLVNE